MKKILQDKISTDMTIQKTLMAGLLFDGFWDRWKVHGVQTSDLSIIRPRLRTLESWVNEWHSLAREKECLAQECLELERTSEGEYLYRVAGIYYNLIYWLFPSKSLEKENWYKECLSKFNLADSLSTFQTEYVKLDDRGCSYFGRIRIPESPIGCMIIVNPIDSSKEELFTYELDFNNAGFVTVSFDGPGQGESFITTGMQATIENWSNFINHVIDFSTYNFKQLPVYLFGTSSGASWAIKGGCDPRVSRVIAISPACKHDTKMPDYFKERMRNVVGDFKEGFLPKLVDLQNFSPTLIFHGGKDVMVEYGDILELYNKISNEKRLIQYENEGHCCNYKLEEIRKMTTKWLQGGSINEV